MSLFQINDSQRPNQIIGINVLTENIQDRINNMDNKQLQPPIDN